LVKAPESLRPYGHNDQNIYISQTPPYLPNGEGLEKFYYIIGFRTLENGGIGHLQIPKKKPKLDQNVYVTQKPQIFISCKPDTF
jgi:hypothetical protein